MSQKSEAKDLKMLQQELKKAQHDLKVKELQERRETEIRHLEWEKERFKLQLEHDKERWTFDSKKQEQSDLKEKIGELNAQVAIYKPFFDKHMAEHKIERENSEDQR
jgi:hypothetical protein